MATNGIIRLSVREVCEASGLTRETLVEIVHEGIVEPHGERAGEWEFDAEAPALLRRAARLHEDLQIEWGGVALVLHMLDELEKMRAENEMLRRRLQRFLSD